MGSEPGFERPIAAYVYSCPHKYSGDNTVLLFLKYSRSGDIFTKYTAHISPSFEITSGASGSMYPSIFSSSAVEIFVKSSLCNLRRISWGTLPDEFDDTTTDLNETEDKMTDTSQTVKTVEHTANDTAMANELPTSVTREDLVIDPVFQKKFEKTPEEYEALKELIRKDGKIQDALKGWKEELMLLDGHTRLEIHEELELPEPLQIQWLSFPDRVAAEIWLIQHQIARRNLNTFRMIEYALESKDLFAAKAKKNQEAGVSLNPGEGIDTEKELAKIAKTSEDSVRKVAKILEKKDNEEIAKYIDALRKGAPKVSIHGVFLKCCKMGKASKTKSPKEQAEPSKGLEKKVQQTLKHFTTLASEYNEMTDGIYICDQMIEWAKERKAKIKAAKKGKKKASKKALKKGTKKGSKKAAKKRTKKSAKKSS